jgi:predicted HTH transcriptional regulator
MLRSEIERLITELSGDEHTWIDLKRHYPIDEERGNKKKGDFIKDIAAMANTVSLEPEYGLRFLSEKERYILIGVDDGTTDIVGTTEDLDGYTSLLDTDTSTPQALSSWAIVVPRFTVT